MAIAKDFSFLRGILVVASFAALGVSLVSAIFPADGACRCGAHDLLHGGDAVLVRVAAVAAASPGLAIGGDDVDDL